MNIALLIDADNASHCLVNDILKEVSNRGRVTIKRAYGDFMKNCCLNPWIDKLKLNSIEVKQNFNHSVGKNSTDIALVIDAMDIMHNNTVQGFCIVSSDSDFTHLAYRIRSQGFFCMGVGRYNTLPAFKDACDEFIFTDNISHAKSETNNPKEVINEIPKLPGLSIVGKVDLSNFHQSNRFR